MYPGDKPFNSADVSVLPKGFKSTLVPKSFKNILKQL
jgi:hypothetical protein